MSTTTASVAARLADLPLVREAITADTPAHAWLFTGPPGAGRSVGAQCLAAVLQCETGTGCGQCEGCRAVFGGSHPDVLHVVPEELTLSVAQVRDIIEEAAKNPMVGRWRVIVLEDADRLSEAAANALLKTVEEPPPATVIIMCAPSTDPADFSMTLRSRCRHVYVPTPSMEAVVHVLRDRDGVSEEVARLAASSSWNHIGRARRLATSPDAQSRRADIIRLAELVFQGDAAFQAVTHFVTATKTEAEQSHAEADAAERKTLETALGIGAKGRGTAKALRGAAAQLKDLEKKQAKQATRRMRDLFDLSLTDLSGVYRDALMQRTGATVHLVHPDFAELSGQLAQRVSAGGLLACLDAIARTRESFAQNVTPLIALDGMVGRLRQACGAH